jgi:type IV pilus assembly protein PilY1
MDQEGLIIYIGTGKHLELSDDVTTGVPTQSLYAIWDEDAAVASPRARLDLLAQTIDAVIDGDKRVTSDHAIDWAVHKGWYMDLPDDSGERLVSAPILRNERIIFTSLIPDPQVCVSSMKGWLMELDAFSGRRQPVASFDLNGDKVFTDGDLVTIYINGEPEKITVSGLASTVGALTTPKIVMMGKAELKVSGGSTGQPFTAVEHPGKGGYGRQAWRTLP